MKLPISDKFLLIIYDFFEEVEKALEAITPPRSVKQFLYYWEIEKLKRKYEREKRRRNFYQFLYYLKKKGYIKIENLEGKKGILLTKKGKQEALKIKFKTMKKKRRKDGKLEMLIFDIPEKYRKLRDIFRNHLKFLGYQMLQKSVWLTPFDVFKETEKLIREYSLDKYIRRFIIEEVEI